MLVIKNHHCKEHQQCVEDVDKNLVLHQVAIITLDILDNANNGPNQDEDAGGVKGVNMATPDLTQINRWCGRMVGITDLEHNGSNCEETEEYNLYEKTPDDDMFAGRRIGGILDHNSRTCNIMSLMSHRR